MIVVVGGIKGGSGKTTLSLNLTVMRSRDSKKLLLVDADEQKSSSAWCMQRECNGIKTDWTTVEISGKAVHTQIKKLKEKFDDIVVDVGGRDTYSLRAAMLIADVCVIPFEPSSLDVWTVSAMKSALNEIKLNNPSLREILLINKGDPIGSDNKEALEVLNESGLNCYPQIVMRRKIFKSSVADGLGVIEVKNPDKKANQEISQLYTHVFNT